MEEKYRINQRHAARVWRRKNQLGDNARCYICGNHNPDHSGLRTATAKQKSLIEAHHLAGLHRGDTINLCVYCHLVMTNFQYDWPSILLDKDRSERMELAAICKGMADVYRFIADECDRMAESLKQKETAEDDSLLEEEVW